MKKQDVRWKQRFSNYTKALNKLTDAVKYVKDKRSDKAEKNIIDEILKEGVIQRFEYTHELAWNVMKDFLLEVGNIKTYGSKDATKEAFNTGLINKGEIWMEMIKSRNKTSHTYNEDTADEIFNKIVNEYHSVFIDFEQSMKGKINE